MAYVCAQLHNAMLVLVVNSNQFEYSLLIQAAILCTLVQGQCLTKELVNSNRAGYHVISDSSHLFGRYGNRAW